MMKSQIGPGWKQRMPWARIPKFKFGQYQGEYFDTITEEEPHYYFWGKAKRRRSAMLEECITWVEANYDVDEQEKSLAKEGTDETFRVKEEASSSQMKPKKTVANKVVSGKFCEPACDPSRMSGVGSNGDVIRKTCLKCGRVTQTPRIMEEPKEDP